MKRSLTDHLSPYLPSAVILSPPPVHYSVFPSSHQWWQSHNICRQQVLWVSLYRPQGIAEEENRKEKTGSLEHHLWDPIVWPQCKRQWT